MPIWGPNPVHIFLIDRVYLLLLAGSFLASTNFSSLNRGVPIVSSSFILFLEVSRTSPSPIPSTTLEVDSVRLVSLMDDVKEGT